MVEGPAPCVQWERAMIARSSSTGDYAVLAVILGLAAVFIYTGFQKLQDPLDFADSIAGFRILPGAFINQFALALPPFEICTSSEPIGQVGNGIKRGSGPSVLKLRLRSGDAAGVVARWFSA